MSRSFSINSTIVILLGHTVKQGHQRCHKLDVKFQWITQVH